MPPTFLCVDDEPSVLITEKALLESAGFHVLTAACESDALAIFRREQVDAVIMDYWMAEMNGIKAARKMKELRPEVPIVFLSAYSEILDETLAWQNGGLKRASRNL